jgi:uncharacterized protein (DUF4415 family)
MISDEPEEDADALDDDAAFENLLGDAPAKPDGTSALLDSVEWPNHSAHGIGLRVDAETLTWFKATHPDWQRQMCAVLRAWMIANEASRQPVDLAALAGDQP